MNFIKRFGEVFRVFGLCLTAFVVFASCIDSARPYPIGWSPPHALTQAQTCPLLNGLYYETGEIGNFTGTGEDSDWLENIRSLSYHFTSGDRRIKDATHVELIQSSNAAIEVVVLQVQHDRNVLHRETLFMKNGDFTCDAEGLKLKRQWEGMFYVITMGISTQERIVNRSEDGSLLMKRNYSSAGFYFFPLVGGGNHWVRWFQASNPTS